jgi:hypothetical protein
LPRSTLASNQAGLHPYLILASYIWYIEDDKTNGQILPTNYLVADPVNNIDYFEADSPLGLSTFGLSSPTGGNNPFQIITFVGSNIINKGIASQTGQGSGG